jgi:hypothetical protein
VSSANVASLPGGLPDWCDQIAVLTELKPENIQTGFT